MTHSAPSSCIPPTAGRAAQLVGSGVASEKGDALLLAGEPLTVNDTRTIKLKEISL